MKYKLLILTLVILLLQTSFVMASPVISIDEDIRDRDFYSNSYTNPDSVEAHQIVAYSEDGEHSQIHLNYRLTPRITTSPDGNYSVYKKALDSVNGVGIEDFVINDTANGTETNIKNIITMGYYAVAFSPDSKMYAAPRIIFTEDCRNGQYTIDIYSVHNNSLLHRELLPIYKEDTKSTPMDWDRAAMFGVYWSEDGSSITYEALGANIDGGKYPTDLISKRLNLDYAKLRKMNGYEDDAGNTHESETENENIAIPNIPGFGALTSTIAVVLNRKLRRT